MSQQSSAALAGLIEEIDDAVRVGEVGATTSRIKTRLREICIKRLELPERYYRPADGRYARRLLHRNEELGYTVVVMTWGAGQQTQLHDHAGMWCVECVVQGTIEVQQFDLAEREAQRHRFVLKKRVMTGVGDAGCLIPPFEYHILSNAHGDETAITMHVYGGEMDSCNCYKPDGADWYLPETVALGYDN